MDKFKIGKILFNKIVTLSKFFCDSLFRLEWKQIVLIFMLLFYNPIFDILTESKNVLSRSSSITFKDISLKIESKIALKITDKLKEKLKKISSDELKVVIETGKNIQNFNRQESNYLKNRASLKLLHSEGIIELNENYKSQISSFYNVQYKLSEDGLLLYELLIDFSLDVFDDVSDSSD
ncbi:MAG: hypothetical protein J7647_14525 [Cyanobacteria bacterium SBLK]|nr:hypothetical protein [Cyanobacteria bacterium SBLK]